MQNKPNLLDAQMNVNAVMTKDYENKSNWNLVKTKPIQSQYKANTNPISERPKMNENLFATKVYENITTFRLEKNKPNQTQFQSHRLSKLFLFFTFLCPGSVLTNQSISSLNMFSFCCRREIYGKKVCANFDNRACLSGWLS
jgi:hypothetical protein